MAMAKNISEKCKHIKRTYLTHAVDEDLAKELSKSYDMLPLFEKSVLEHKLVKHYSLERNELLKCRWKAYKMHLDNIEFSPYKFPEHKHFHFYKNNIRYQPSETIADRKDFRMKLRPGPGVDSVGQIPIPFERMMKRGIARKEDKESGKKKRSVESQKRNN